MHYEFWLNFYRNFDFVYDSYKRYISYFDFQNEGQKPKRNVTKKLKNINELFYLGFELTI